MDAASVIDFGRTFFVLHDRRQEGRNIRGSLLTKSRSMAADSITLY